MNLILALIFVMSTAYATETRRKIVVVDTGLGWYQDDAPFLCKDVKAVSVTGGDIYDDHGHGTNIISLISKRIDTTKWCITSIKYYGGGMGYYLAALKIASQLKNVGTLNLSLEGLESNEMEEQLILSFLRKGANVVVAAGNDRIDLNNICGIYPACYRQRIIHKRFRVVGGLKMERSNTGRVITDWRPAVNIGFPKMTGTSQATALKSAEMSK